MIAIAFQHPVATGVVITLIGCAVATIAIAPWRTR